ncbi:MAG: hypothetical protein H7X79_06335 [Sporomusaceae bacterium]|nr:hypothetical protein [Sporomusaceae bacterium]
MDCCENSDSDDFSRELNVEQLEKRAVKLAAFYVSAATAGNAVVVFTMLAMQEILEQLLANPVDNLTSIIQVASSISSLNNSIRVVP